LITTTRDPAVRFAIPCWSRHCWRTCGGVRLVPVARPTAGGRDQEFTFKTFCDWIRHELEEELRRRWKIK